MKSKMIVNFMGFILKTSLLFLEYRYGLFPQVNIPASHGKKSPDKKRIQQQLVCCDDYY